MVLLSFNISLKYSAKWTLVFWTISCCHWCPSPEFSLEAALFSPSLRPKLIFLPFWKIVFHIRFTHYSTNQMLKVKLSGYHWASQWKWATTGHGAREWWKSKIPPTFPEVLCLPLALSCLKQGERWSLLGVQYILPLRCLKKHLWWIQPDLRGNVVAHMLEGILASFLPVTLWIHSVNYNLALNVQFQANSFQMDTLTKLKMKPNPVTNPRLLPQWTNSHQYGLAYPFLHQKLCEQKRWIWTTKLIKLPKFLICQQMYFSGNRIFYFFASRAEDTEQKNNFKTILCVWRLNLVYLNIKFNFFL